MTSSEKGEIIRPFGPSIGKFNIPKSIIKTLNDYVDNIIIDKKKSEKLNKGKYLAGNVTQEFRLEQGIMKKSGWAEFLTQSTGSWIYNSCGKKISKLRILDSWVVRQFENEYNPIHWHDGHISGAGFLKVPSNFGKTVQEKKNTNKNGQLQLIHGSNMFLGPSTLSIIPKVGEFYFFPNYLMHTVYPFVNTKEERRSISFNAFIDDDIYNVYSEKI
ncbi:MAG: hypothetical protein CFH26_00160 [Alphaproteobacteria bacterium MarineAlpha6_Bin4]|nr:MAG: hypothetical protein CFH26_00160 [Alphaproteobacteria bacterium MarineAlpha6_Bin4]|tara:strand:+ start:1211 stop:1858 length:648 start_codon:yes stop_codon:yes gene_type:complete